MVRFAGYRSTHPTAERRPRVTPLPLPILAAGAVDRFLGLSRVSCPDPRAVLSWRWPLPLWGWVLVAAAAAIVAGWSYRRLLGPCWARVGLAGIRGVILLLIAALLVGPMLVLNQEKVEPDWL